ncbi:MAG TPA: inverse autotransporter beta domain-containing protein [Pseudolabrys sp.]|nr:inverse autotransporter beta domain-containing protein [Pseudolabrys sp.]
MIGDAALAAAWSQLSSQPKWAPSISFEGRPGTKRNLGEVDLFAPLIQTDRSLLFGNVRGRFDDEHYLEGNVGLGLRHMMAGWNLGLYGYYDRKRSGLGNTFNQATFGIEALGHDFDVRANAYVPFGDRVKDAGSTAAESFASLIGTTIQVTTLGTTTREERALRGFDAEVGWRVPIWSADDVKTLRLYAGVFHFDDDVVKAVTGPRLRAELTMYDLPQLWDGSRLTLGAEFQHDDVRGSQGFGLVRLTVPLQAPGKAVRLSAQERRMTERVVRDIDIVTQTSTSQAPTIVETAIATAGGMAIAVIDSGSTAGDDLPTAVANAGADSTVILTGSFITTAPTTLQSGQTLMGAGSLSVRSVSGRIATLSTPGATISSTAFGNTAAVEMATNSTLTGMTINQTGNGIAINPFGVQASGASGATIVNNTISVTSTNLGTAFGIRVLDGSSNVTVSGNKARAINNGGGGAIAFQMSSNGGAVSAHVSGNTFGATGNPGRVVDLVGSAPPLTVLSGSTGNVRANGVCNVLGTVFGSIGFTDGSTCP